MNPVLEGFFVGCYTNNNGASFGTGFSQATAPVALGASFTFEASLNSGTGQVTLTFSNLENDGSNGVYTHDCGVYGNYANLGDYAGMGIINFEESVNIIVDDFGSCPRGRGGGGMGDPRK